MFMTISVAAIISCMTIIDHDTGIASSTDCFHIIVGNFSGIDA